MIRPHFIWILVAGVLAALESLRSASAQPELGRSLTLSQVRAILKAAPSHANFAGKQIINLDLGNLDDGRCEASAGR